MTDAVVQFSCPTIRSGGFRPRHSRCGLRHRDGITTLGGGDDGPPAWLTLEGLEHRHPLLPRLARPGEVEVMEQRWHVRALQPPGRTGKHHEQHGGGSGRIGAGRDRMGQEVQGFLKEGERFCQCRPVARCGEGACRLKPGARGATQEVHRIRPREASAAHGRVDVSLVHAAVDRVVGIEPFGEPRSLERHRALGPLESRILRHRHRLLQPDRFARHTALLVDGHEGRHAGLDVVRQAQALDGGVDLLRLGRVADAAVLQAFHLGTGPQGPKRHGRGGDVALGGEGAVGGRELHVGAGAVEEERAAAAGEEVRGVARGGVGTDLVQAEGDRAGKLGIEGLELQPDVVL